MSRRPALSVPAMISVVLLALTAVPIAACSPGQRAEPSTSDVTATPTPSTQAPAGGLHPATARGVVYFSRREKVAPAYRLLNTPAVAHSAMLSLLAGPDGAERAAGMSSEIPAGTRLLGVEIADGTAVVDLSAEFGSGGGSLSMGLRVAEVVHTLTQFGNVDRVVFKIEDRRVEALGGEGLLLEEPQTRAHWEQHAPAVLIESPAFGEPTAMPLVVKGSANVFEGRFALDLQGPLGTTLASNIVQATSGTGTRGVFTSTFDVDPWGPGPATLWAWYASPKDGTRVDVFEVPIRAAR